MNLASFKMKNKLIFKNLPYAHYLKEQYFYPRSVCGFHALIQSFMILWTIPL